MPSTTVPPFDSADLADLATALEGGLILPRSEDYERTRRVWNAAIDHRPAAIARCATVEDVRRAVAFAAARGLPLSVRSGGHSINGASVGEGSLMVDLSAVSEIDVDPRDRILTVRGGATWGEIMERCAPYGLATPGAFNHRVGVGGVTLGGGYGALSRLHGLSCDNLLEADVVTADGELMRASANENPELFWALRGAGANFGVVTAMRLRLHPVETWLAGAAYWPVARHRQVLEFYRDFSPGLPDEATAYLGIKNLPRQDGYVFIVCLYTGPEQEGRRLFEPLHRLGPPASIDLRPRSYLELHDCNAEAFPEGHRNYWKACFLSELGDGVAETLSASTERSLGTDFYAVIEHMGGAMGRPAAEASAFPHRDARFGIAIAAKWRRPADGDVLVQEARALHRSLWPLSTGGAYVNYLGCDTEPDMARAAYGGNLPRLEALKGRYDPANLFRFNINIEPRVGSDASESP